jgi:ABC-type uncharacterized transport system involved in gliding motility auxiliary subunit
MKALQKFKDWIAGPKSDFFLFVVVLVLLNIAGARAFLRIDLTAQHSYSLSKASKEVVRTIEEPLSVKVFFSSNLPAPYNSVERYLRDILVEYKGAANRNFSYDFFDMEKPDNQTLARSYGLNTVQIQEVKDNEVGLKTAWMGLAIVYSDGIEVIDNLSSTDGLEYRLTTTLGRMIAKTNALSGLTDKVKVTLYTSPELSKFGITGYNDLEKNVSAVFDAVNRKNRNKLIFAHVEAKQSDVDSLASRYGLQKLTWSDRKDGAQTGSGVLGIVMEYSGGFRTVPLELARGLFGGYGVVGLDKLEKTLGDNLQALMSKSLTVGYVTGHGEKNLADEQKGAARLSALVSDTYEFKDIDTTKDEIPANVTSLVINGPTGTFTDAELYKIDQFLMRGGNVFMLLDPFEEIAPEGQLAMYGGQPTYRPINTGLQKLLGKYGVVPGTNYVLDKNCYVSRQQSQGDVPIYYVPLLGKDGLNAKNPISRNLAYVLFLQSGSVDIAANADTKARKIVTLASSSAESWLMKDNISLMPFAMQVPGQSEMAQHPLAVLLEGKFDSAFDKPPVQAVTAGATAGTQVQGMESFSAEAHLAKSVQPGKIIVTGTSAITGSAVMDAAGKEPIAIFVRNAIDYLNGNGELIEMRTKGLSLNTLNKAGPSIRAAIRAVNLYGLPLLVIAAGLFAWRRRVWRRRSIEARYGSDAMAKTEVK